MKRPNVILLSIDALRADHLSYHGYHRDTAPRLDERSKRWARFDRAISASSHTREALPALLTGRHPDVFADEGYRLTTESIASRLSDAGYATAGFHSNPYVSRVYGFDRGFDEFDDDLLLGKSRLIALAQRFIEKFLVNRGDYHVRASELNRRALAWLDGLDDEPFFLWNHYMDPHGPYNPPDEYSEYASRAVSNTEAQSLYQKCIKRPADVTDRERELLVDLYDGEIRYLDAYLSEFLEALEARELLDHSLVIVTADHGDGFGEHGYFTHPRQLYEELLHVPLLVHVPESEPQRFEQVVSTLDIVPTVLDAVGLDGSDGPGTSLWSPGGGGMTTATHPGVAYSSAQGEDEDAHVRRFALRDERWKCVLERDIERGEILDERGYDLTTDPGERDPIPRDAMSERLIELATRVREHSDTRPVTVEDESEPPTDDDIEERLEALGYK